MGNRYFDSNSDKIPDEAYLEEEEGYRTLKESKPLPRGWFIIPVLLVGIVIVVLMAIWFRDTPQSTQADGRIQQIEDRIVTLEMRLAELNAVEEKLSALERDGQAYLQAIERLNRLETTVSMRVDQIYNSLTAQQTKKPTPQTQKQPSAKPAATKAKTVTHVVKSGDTLYAIGRQYNLSIDQLRRDNNLGKISTIKPGQKLIIKTAQP
jgi:LysM repeat protein